MFEHGKVYRFNPTKTKSFKPSVRNNKLQYTNVDLWQLDIKNNVFFYKGKATDEILLDDGYAIKRNWCEEVK